MYTWFLINKEFGIPSFQILSCFSKYTLLDIGYCGSLDPFASGVLLLSFNCSSKLLQFLIFLDKNYLTLICWGLFTFTSDVSLSLARFSHISLSKLIIFYFFLFYLGSSYQSPHFFSSSKISSFHSIDFIYYKCKFILFSKYFFLKKIIIIANFSNFIIFSISLNIGYYVRSLILNLNIFSFVFFNLVILKRSFYRIFNNFYFINSCKIKYFLNKNFLYVLLISLFNSIDCVFVLFSIHSLSLLFFKKLNESFSLFNFNFLSFRFFFINFFGYFIFLSLSNFLTLLKIF